MRIKEWRDANGKKVGSTSSSMISSGLKNYPDQTDRYKKLLAQIDSDKICTYTVNELTDRILNITVNTKNKTNLKIKIVYKPYCNPPCYSLIANDKEVNDLTYEEVLDLLEMAAVISNTNLCESTLADEFKTYENMWDNLNEWIDSNGNKIVSNSFNRTPTQNSTNSVSTAVSTAIDHSKEFKKLFDYLESLYEIDYSFMYHEISKYELCLRFTKEYLDPKDNKTYFLDVTSTDASGYTLKERWDLRLSQLKPKIEDLYTGEISGYAELLDILLKHDIIIDKTKCY